MYIHYAAFAVLGDDNETYLDLLLSTMPQARRAGQKDRLICFPGYGPRLLLAIATIGICCMNK
jgi:hypothetical protein